MDSPKATDYGGMGHVPKRIGRLPRLVFILRCVFDIDTLNACCVYAIDRPAHRLTLRTSFNAILSHRQSEPRQANNRTLTLWLFHRQALSRPAAPVEGMLTSPPLTAT